MAATAKGRQVQAAVLVRDELMAEIDSLALAEGVSRSDIIRRWLMIARLAEAAKVAQALEAREQVA